MANQQHSQTPKKCKPEDNLRLINSPAQKQEDLFEGLIRHSPPKRLFFDNESSLIEEEEPYSSSMVEEEDDSKMVGQPNARQRTPKIFNYDNSSTSKRMLTPKKSGKGCKCEKSHCLKKYCDCYKVGGVCSEECSCIGCENTLMTSEHEKLAKVAEMTRSGKGGRQLKCNCLRSHCLKDYCECHSAGKTCSSACNCIQCENKMEMTTKSKKKRQFMYVSDWSDKKGKDNVLFN